MCAYYTFCSPMAVLHVPHTGHVLVPLVGFSCHDEADGATSESQAHSQDVVCLHNG